MESSAVGILIAFLTAFRARVNALHPPDWRAKESAKV